MSDTLLGPPAVATGSVATFVHNSTVVQRGHCFTPVMGGTTARPADLVPAAGGGFCWQSAGVTHAATLVVFCTMVEAADGPPGFAFRVTGSTLASFALPGLTYVGTTPLPFTEPDGIRWGTGAVLQRGDWVYVYGRATAAQYVARVRFDQLTSGPWYFWTGNGWSDRAASRR